MHDSWTRVAQTLKVLGFVSGGAIAEVLASATNFSNVFEASIPEMHHVTGTSHLRRPGSIESSGLGLLTLSGVPLLPQSFVQRHLDRPHT
jgi:hypothetical protein